MIFDVYTVAYNEEKLLPHFLHHYREARRIVVFDNDSTDNTASIAKAYPVTVRRLNTGGKYDETAQTALRNSCWRESDADWVVVADVDELVDLTPLAGVDPCQLAFRCRGRNMIGADGEPLADIRRCLPPGACIPGVETRYDKISVFSPRIAAINYAPGMHTAEPTCPAIESPRLLLRHYCWLGEEWMVKRFGVRRHRISDDSRRHGYGHQYLMNEHEIRKAYRCCLELSVLESELPCPR